MHTRRLTGDTLSLSLASRPAPWTAVDGAAAPSGGGHARGSTQSGRLGNRNGEAGR